MRIKIRTSSQEIRQCIEKILMDSDLSEGEATLLIKFVLSPNGSEQEVFKVAKDRGVNLGEMFVLFGNLVSLRYLTSNRFSDGEHFIFTGKKQ